MKYHALFVIFEKAAKIRNWRLLHIVDGALWVNEKNCHYADLDLYCLQRGSAVAQW